MNFLLLLVFGCCIVVSFGGNVKWSLSKEEEAYSLYRKYCNGKVREGEDGNARWYCKSLEDEEEPVVQKSIEHVFQILINSTKAKKDVVFIETPPKKYEHKIFVTGKYALKKDTDIYVVPAKDQHVVNVDSEIKVKENNESNKPKTLFLTKNPITFRLPSNLPFTESPLPFGPPYIAKSPPSPDVSGNKENILPSNSTTNVHNHGRPIRIAQIN